MDADIKRDWIAALTSGNYTQGNERLRWYDWEDPDTGSESFCCLGVLCDVINPSGWFAASSPEGEYFCHFDGYAPEEFLDKKIQEKLVVFNDDEGWDFNKIAEWIGENL